MNLLSVFKKKDVENYANNLRFGKLYSSQRNHYKILRIGNQDRVCPLIIFLAIHCKSVVNFYISRSLAG